MIKAVELENPYRYRGYMVGKRPVLDIQNDNVVDTGDHGIVTKIEGDASYAATSRGLSIIEVYFEDGSYILLNNLDGLIVSYEDEA